MEVHVFMHLVLLFTSLTATDVTPDFSKARTLVALQRKAEQRAALTANPLANPVQFKVFRFLNSTVYIKTYGYNALMQLYIIKELKKETKLDGEALYSYMKKKYGKLLESCTSTIKSDSTLPMPGRMNCCPFPKVKCKAVDKIYRTFDGSCNCLQKPNMGRSNRAFSRFLPSDYADGISEPRRAKNGKPLPSARKVSVELYRGRFEPKSPVLTMMHMSLGQIVDHDTDRTPVSMLLSENGSLIPFMCGKDGCKTEGRQNAECFPIPIPKNDPTFNKKCLMFVRSQAFLADGCEIVPRQQVNVITSWFDASFLYGSSKAENANLRDRDSSRGKMQTIPHPLNKKCGPLIPTQNDPACRDLTAKIQCFLAGDARQNEQAALIALHIMFVRLHNYFEGKLHSINPHWKGEKLFQESRRLLIAVWQNIVYGEYLPPLLGPSIMKKYALDNLKKGCFKGYDCKRTNGDISNVFAHSAFRFSHSQVGQFITLTDKTLTQRKKLTFQEVFFRPRTVYETHFHSTCGVEALLLGQAVQFADESDILFAPSVRNHLFTETPPKGLGTDLPALDTQRGRDHAIAGYNKWRKWCGLPIAKSFQKMHDIPKADRKKFAKLYDHVDDVDLFPAAMAENHIPGGIVGPTFACILARQFRNVKIADRFWFENCGPNGFTQAQLDNIREYTSGRMLCDTLDDVKKIQKFTMMKPKKDAFKSFRKPELFDILALYKGCNNIPEDCRKHAGINFKLWKEKPVYTG